MAGEAVGTWNARGVCSKGLDMRPIYLQLRIPPKMHKALVADAKRNHRSVNSEVLWRIDASAIVRAELEELEARAMALVDQLAITEK